MKLSYLLLIAASGTIAGCSSTPSCDGSDEQNTVFEIARSRPNPIERGLAGADFTATERALKSDSTFIQLTKKMNDAQAALDAALSSCHLPTPPYSFVGAMQDPSINYGYSSKPGEYSREAIDSKAICKSAWVDTPDGMQSEVEGDEAYHKANITPAAYALADSIKKWNEYRSQFTERRKAEGADALKSLQYRMENIIMTATDKDTGAVSCKANLVGEAPGLGSAQRPIAYTVEKTSEGKLYATVWGL